MHRHHSTEVSPGWSSAGPDEKLILRSAGPSVGLARLYPQNQLVTVAQNSDASRGGPGLRLSAWRFSGSVDKVKCDFQDDGPQLVRVVDLL